MRRAARALAALALAAAGCGGGAAGAGAPPDDPLALDPAALEALGRAIGDSRIVLLGENGHGVGEFSRIKADLVRWLHEARGFDVVAFESGFFECGHAWRDAAAAPPRETLLRCLRYPFQHAELLPLFETIRASADSPRPLVLAGIDLQAQGFDSGPRPRASWDALRSVDAALARRAAALDSALFLVPDSGGLGPSIHAWAHRNRDEALAAYRAAAAATEGEARWRFRLAEGWVERLAVRGRAEAEGAAEIPDRYYELRDEWMARAVAALADSIAGPRKVVVWLHNDHARYGDIGYASYTSRSAGGYLRDAYGDDVFSVGFFMGRGTIADNGRNERAVAPPPPGGLEDFLGGGGAPLRLLVLRDAEDPEVRRWAGAPRPYLRMGVDPDTLVPAEEFDALVYVDRVGPPEYRLP